MARKFSSTAVQEELYPLPESRDYGAREYSASERDARAHEPFDDSRFIDLEAEQDSPFLRAQKRVSVRRGSLPKKAASSLKWAGLALVILAASGIVGTALYRYGKHSWRFRIDSSDQIEVSGGQHVPRAQIMDVIGGDIGRNIFFVPLAERQHQIEQIPWVESASVMRFVPNRLRIEIRERTPVAFARIGSHISLIDADGNLMEFAPGPRHKYSFPVITGMNATEPRSTRAARMKNYNDLMQQLDSGGAHYSQDISEVDLTDTEDVKVMTSDPGGGVLVHLGSGNYLQRYKVYVTHVQAWRQQFEKLDAVDLRFDGQIIVNPDLQGIARQPALTPAAAKAALAAGVKTAAIVNYEKYVTHPLPVSAGKVAQPKTKASGRPADKPGAKTAPKAAAHRTAPKVKKAVVAQKAAVSHPLAPSAPNSAPGKATTHSMDLANTKPAATAVPAAPTAGTPNDASLKTPAPLMTTQATTPKPATPVPSPSAAVAGTQKKPSAGIPKETPQN